MSKLGKFDLELIERDEALAKGLLKDLDAGKGAGFEQSLLDDLRSAAEFGLKQARRLREGKTKREDEK